MIPSRRALVLAPCLALGACGYVFGGGYADRLPVDDSGGVAIRSAIVSGDSWGGHSPGIAMLVDVDAGSFGYRFASYLGAVQAFGDGPFGFVRGGVSLLSLGHARSDPDPDPWVGVSATVQGGGWLPLGDDLRIELGLGLAADTGWTGAGAGAYTAVWLGLGRSFDLTFDMTR